jgi:hypothetical protein
VTLGTHGARKANQFTSLHTKILTPVYTLRNSNLGIETVSLLPLASTFSDPEYISDASKLPVRDSNTKIIFSIHMLIKMEKTRHISPGTIGIVNGSLMDHQYVRIRIVFLFEHAAKKTALRNT